MRIVITGATGFIGSYLATLFLREGAEVFALSRPDSPNLKALPVHENLHIVPWSMDRAGDCVSQIGSADAFFHFAWGGVNRQEIDSPEVQAKNVAGSLECIRAAKALSCSVFMDAAPGWSMDLRTESCLRTGNAPPLTSMERPSGNFTRRRLLCAKSWGFTISICGFSVSTAPGITPGRSSPLWCGSCPRERAFP